jgi:predicted DNA-binding transcriptional regulator AlpA
MSTWGDGYYGCPVERRVRLDDLIDAVEVAEILGLSRATSVYVYLRRYDDMPRPVIDRGPNRARLWLRPEIETWHRIRQGA